MIAGIPTYQSVLAEAGAWRKSPDAAALQRAETILRQGLTDYPFAPAVRDELALVLEQQGRDAEAYELVREYAERVLDAGEETLARVGKIFKKLAEGQLARGNLAAAYTSFAEAERYYGYAFDKTQGFYPRINQLSVRLARAAVARELGRTEEAEQLVKAVQTDTRAFLAQPDHWRARKPDDAIWMPATQGEANVLLGNWPAAEAAFADAMRAAGGDRFYHDCMSGQLRSLVLPALQRLGLPIEGRLADPAPFFAPPH
jgi:hypothetical protein